MRLLRLLIVALLVCPDPVYAGWFARRGGARRVITPRSPASCSTSQRAALSKNKARPVAGQAATDRPAIPPEPSPEVRALEHFKSWNDERLDQYLGVLLARPAYFDDPEYEPLLTMMIRRGMGDKLKEHYYALIERPRVKGETPPRTLELLTAVRRAKHQPDPLVIRVEHFDGPFCATRRGLGRLCAEIENVDVDRQTVIFQHGGDYNHRDSRYRHERWRIVLINERGESMPPAPFPGTIERGKAGFEALEQVPFGASDSGFYHIPFDPYVEAPPPGKYQLKVVRHNQRFIGDRDDLTGLILVESEPIQIEIGRVPLEIARRDHARAAELIQQLDFWQPVKILAGTYLKWGHEFVDPGSTHGQILALGPSAVPALVAALDEQNAARKNAWLFALLFSITGDHDPRAEFSHGHQVLPEYEYWENSWDKWGRPKTRVPMFVSGKGKGGPFQVKREDQLRFIDAWRRWKANADITFVDAKPESRVQSSDDQEPPPKPVIEEVDPFGN